MPGLSESRDQRPFQVPSGCSINANGPASVIAPLADLVSHRPSSVLSDTRALNSPEVNVPRTRSPSETISVEPRFVSHGPKKSLQADARLAGGAGGEDGGGGELDGGKAPLEPDRLVVIGGGAAALTVSLGRVVGGPGGGTGGGAEAAAGVGTGTGGVDGATAAALAPGRIGATPRAPPPEGIAEGEAEGNISLIFANSSVLTFDSRSSGNASM